MKVRELVKHWEKQPSTEKREHQFKIRLPLEDAARVHALSDLFPEQTACGILDDMLAASLEDLAQTRQLKDRLAEK